LPLSPPRHTDAAMPFSPLRHAYYAIRLAIFSATMLLADISPFFLMSASYTLLPC